MRIPKHLAEAYNKARKELREFANSLEGREARWTSGKYIGRRCRIKRAIFDEEAPEHVEVVVETYRKNGEGFVQARDHWHYSYREIEGNFEILPNPKEGDGAHSFFSSGSDLCF